MALRWELLMALAMLGSLDGPSLEASHGPCYARELGWPFVGSFSWPLLCLGAWMALPWELLMALAKLGSLDGPSLEASFGPLLCLAFAMLGSLDGPSLGDFYCS